MPQGGFRRGGGGRRGDRNSPRARKLGPDGEEKSVEVEGTITSVLAGTQFRVQLQSGHEVLAHISGKMRKRFIRLRPGEDGNVSLRRDQGADHVPSWLIAGVDFVT